MQPTGGLSGTASKSTPPPPLPGTGSRQEGSQSLRAIMIRTVPRWRGGDTPTRNAFGVPSLPGAHHSGPDVQRETEPPLARSTLPGLPSSPGAGGGRLGLSLPVSNLSEAPKVRGSGRGAEREVSGIPHHPHPHPPFSVVQGVGSFCRFSLGLGKRPQGGDKTSPRRVGGTRVGGWV